MSFRIGFRTALLFGLLSSLNGCFDKKDDPQAQAGPQMPPAAVSTITVQPKDIPLVFEYSGRAAGFREVEVHSRIDGIILQRTYTEGQKVRAGQVLFRIDPEPFKATLEQNQAALKNQQANLAQTKSDFARVTKLHQEKAISDREFDQAQAAYLQAQASVAQAGAQGKSAQINLGYTTVQAPITGVTSTESVSEGSYVQANSSSSLLTRITQLDPLYVNFAFPDSDALAQRQSILNGSLKLVDGKKLPVEITFADNSGVPTVKGTVDFTASFVDPQTGTVSARAIVANADGSLMPGQFVRVKVEGIVRPNTIVIPAKAVMQSGQGMFVYVVGQDGKAAIKPVTLGMLTPAGQIIESGLADGDQVITEGVIKVRPGAPVNVTPDQAPPTAASANPNGSAANEAPTNDKKSISANSGSSH